MHARVSVTVSSRIRRIIPGCIAGVLLMPLAFGTSPIPAPYHRYVVSGTVLHRDGSPAPEIILVLFARTAHDTALHIPPASMQVDDRPLGISSVEGQFVITVRTFTPADSLAIGTIAPGAPMVRAAAFRPDSSLAYPTKAKGTNATDVGCGGCGTEPSTFEYTVSYTTNISRSVTIE